jgi:hypothetical protein
MKWGEVMEVRSDQLVRRLVRHSKTKEEALA